MSAPSIYPTPDHDGVTLRQYAAVHILAGMLADPDVAARDGDWPAFKHGVAEEAVEIADALIAALEVAK